MFCPMIDVRRKTQLPDTPKSLKDKRIYYLSFPIEKSDVPVYWISKMFYWVRAGSWISPKGSSPKPFVILRVRS